MNVQQIENNSRYMCPAHMDEFHPRLNSTQLNSKCWIESLLYGNGGFHIGKPSLSSLSSTLPKSPSKLSFQPSLSSSDWEPLINTETLRASYTETEASTFREAIIIIKITKITIIMIISTIIIIIGLRASYKYVESLLYWNGGFHL